MKIVNDALDVLSIAELKALYDFSTQKLSDDKTISSKQEYLKWVIIKKECGVRLERKGNRLVDLLTREHQELFM